MAPQTQSRGLSIALAAPPEVSGAVLYGIREVMLSVRSSWEELTGQPGQGPDIRTCIVANDRRPTTCYLGVPVQGEASFSDSGRYDVLIVPDLAIDCEFDPRGRWPEACDWLRRQYRQGAVVCSVCTGSVLLAEAGLLNGLEATTHWAIPGIFDKCYPGVKLVPERILVPTGPEHRLITSGGSSSWTDLVLYLIARFCGREHAVRIAKLFLIGDRSDGQLPFACMMRPRRHGDSVIDACLAWIAEHYATSNPVSAMIRESGLADRTFKRRFRAATGYTPIEYVQTLRIEEAKHLLETTGMSTDEIGAAVGYQDPSSFRRLFKRLTGVSPARYRQRFGAVGRVPETAEEQPAHP
ncbi:MAG TPA: helix-turn-helix domain-containing protein [Arenicellales bacterium]|nr:helix-turn-helix domain-containing protein [Arenicellales bacterium]